MIQIGIKMPKSCWQCLFGINDLVREETICHLIFKLRNDAWDIPESIKKGEKREDCPLKEVKDDK